MWMNVTNRRAIRASMLAAMAGALIAFSADAAEQPKPTARSETTDAQPRTTFFRADSTPAKIPNVLLSKSDEAQCRLKVGDAMPAVKLPQLGDGGEKQLADLYGEKATVVVFWKGDRRMALQQLADLGPDVVKPFGQNGVAVVGVAVGETPQNAEAVLKKHHADFPNLLDSGGEAFAQLGTGKLPRTYLLDPQGKILWFDIEYSLATRRELNRALRAVTGAK